MWPFMHLTPLNYVFAMWQYSQITATVTAILSQNNPRSVYEVIYFNKIQALILFFPLMYSVENGNHVSPTQTFLFMYLGLNTRLINCISALQRTKSWLKRPVGLQVVCQTNNESKKDKKKTATWQQSRSTATWGPLRASWFKAVKSLSTALSSLLCSLLCSLLSQNMCNKHKVPILVPKHIIDCVGALGFRWFLAQPPMLHLLK